MVELVTKRETVNKAVISVATEVEDIVDAIVESLTMEDILQVVLNIEEEMADYDFTEGLCIKLLDIITEENDPEEIDNPALRAAVTAYIEHKENVTEDDEDKE